MAKTEAQAAAAQLDEAQTAYDPWTELVPVRLFKDNDKYNEDVFVALNGRRYLIKRGEEVKIPRCIKEVLDNAEAQRREAEEKQNSLGRLL